MNSSLEHIPYDTVYSPERISYKQFRTTLTPLYHKVWIHIAAGYLTLTIPFIIALLTNESFSKWWLIPLWSIWFGYVLAYLHLFVHEAAHFNIHNNKKKNDRLANYLLWSLFALGIKSYRSTHWQHHLHLATPDDREISYFNALTLPFLLKVLSGFHTIHIIFHRKNNIQEKKTSKSNQFVIFLIVQLLWGCVAFLTGGYIMLISWFGGLFVVFPFLATLRQILEHRDENALKQADYYKSKKNTISRLFGKDILSVTFGGAGFNRHILHHWDPQVSYTRLNDVLSFLSRSDETKEIITQAQTSYIKVFRNLFFVK